MKKELTESSQHIIWLIRIKFFVLASVLATTIFASLLGIKFDFYYTQLFLALAFANNFLFHTIAQRNRQLGESYLFNYIRIVIDLIVTTGLVHFSGGIDSPLAILYFTDLVAISLFFSPLMGILMSGHAIIFYSINSLLEAIGFIHHYKVAIIPDQIYSDPGYFVLKSFSLFFITIAIIYSMAYIAGKLREKQNEIEKISSDKIDFMNMVAHELRSPLTSIQEYTEISLDGLAGQISEKQKEALQIIHKQTKRIGGMVDDLLNLANIDSEGVRLKTKAIDLVTLTNYALDEMSPQISVSKINVIKRFGEPTLMVIGDESKIVEVIINFISNAIKFSHDGGSIFITIAKLGRKGEFSIKDLGVGIYQNDLNHIFEKFYRTSLKEKCDKKGTGLGLAISKSIIERHGGQIWGESEGLGHGSTFHFTLPLA